MTDEPTPQPTTEADLLRAHAIVAARAAELSEQLEAAQTELEGAPHIQQAPDVALRDASCEQQQLRDNVERDRAIAQVQQARLLQVSAWLCDLASTTVDERRSRDQERAAYEKAKAELEQLRADVNHARRFARWFRHQGTEEPAVHVLTEQRGPLPDWLERRWTGW